MAQRVVNKRVVKSVEETGTWEQVERWFRNSPLRARIGIVAFCEYLHIDHPFQPKMSELLEEFRDEVRALSESLPAELGPEDLVMLGRAVGPLEMRE